MIEAILDAIPVRVFWKNQDLEIAGCNVAFARDAGFASPHDLVGLDDFSMAWRDQAELYQAGDRAVIASGVPRLHVEEPQTTADGDIITLLTSKVPLRNAAGVVTGVLGTYLDISERKRAEEEVRRLNAELEPTVQARTAELRHSERQLRDIFDGTSELISRVVQGDSAYLLSTLRHITAQRQAAEALRAVNENLDQLVAERTGALRLSEARKAAIFESTLDALITIDHDGRVVEWNLGAERVFGYSAHDAIGHEMAELISSGDSPDIAGRELKLGSGENFLQKPFSADHLADVVRRALDVEPAAAARPILMPSAGDAGRW